MLTALGAGDICLPVQRLQPGGIYSNAIICHHAGASLLLRAYHDGDMAALGIVDDAVADQVIQHPPQKGGIALHAGGTSWTLSGKFKLIPIWQAAVEHLAHRLTADLHQIDRLPADRLEGILQFGGQVQIVHQGFQPLSLPPDDPGLLPGLG